ncbi:hypothetical protein RHMOL_Rhmol04G0142900 [Rhododendron molle]|uniref:Uncharacterized protein n=1 Tax=Rhododendron molle TaxID=49168 RepID=A0ACC0P0G8_RHOML|nr:hypothetical protein RHMOL_Rhmol04G0142900 [Rhododendron molle]
MPQEICVEVLEVDDPLVGESDLISPSRMEVMEEIPYSRTSCVIASLIPEYHQLSVEESSPVRVGGEDDFQDSTLGLSEFAGEEDCGVSAIPIG